MIQDAVWTPGDNLVIWHPLVPLPKLLPFSEAPVAARRTESAARHARRAATLASALLTCKYFCILHWLLASKEEVRARERASERVVVLEETPKATTPEKSLCCVTNCRVKSPIRLSVKTNKNRYNSIRTVFPTNCYLSQR